MVVFVVGVGSGGKVLVDDVLVMGKMGWLLWYWCWWVW